MRGTYFIPVVLLLLIGVVGLFGRRWPVELLTHFYAQFIVLSLVTLGGLIYWRDFVSSVLVAVTIGLVLYQVIGGPTQHQSLSSPRSISMSFLNTRSHSSAVRNYTRELLASDRDIGMYAGVTADGRETVDNVLGDQRSHRQFKVMSEVFGMGLVSRFPVESFDYVHEEVPGISIGGKIPWVQAVITVEGTPVKVWIIHPPRPTSPALFRMRNNMLSVLTDPAFEAHYPDLVIGDFNVSPGSAYYQDISNSPHWFPGNRGNPFMMTWPSSVPPAWISIDHLFVGPAARIDQFDVGSNHGSQHYPIKADLNISTK